MSGFFGKKHKNKPPQNLPAQPEHNHEDHQKNVANKNAANVVNGHKEGDNIQNEKEIEKDPTVQPPTREQSYRRGAPPKFNFHCQQAHGSPTGIISGFVNVKELYQKIAECYDMEPSEILFCTLNSHKVDMKNLLGGQIGLEDFIFAHRRGRAKEVEVFKSDDALGLTITDNGAGYAFIKRIKEDSIIHKLGCIEVGDHLERIDDKSLVGCRHFEVAKILKDIPKGTTFNLRVVEPLKAGFSHIGPRSGPGGKKSGGNMGSGRQTLRFKSNGSAKVEEVDDSRILGEEKINELLEGFLGINDAELASRIWDLAHSSNNTIEFAEVVDSSDLQTFNFTDDFIFELWGAVTDAKSGRLSKKLEQLTF